MIIPGRFFLRGPDNKLQSNLLWNGKDPRLPGCSVGFQSGAWANNKLQRKRRKRRKQRRIYKVKRDNEISI